MPLWLAFILMVLAAYRLTRLATYDSIVDRPRSWLYAKGPEWVGEMVGCPFCIGFWISAAVVGVTWVWYPLPVPGLWWLAVAGGSALIYEGMKE